jgi:hypothetical protein
MKAEVRSAMGPGSPNFNHVTIANNRSNIGSAMYNNLNTNAVITTSILWGNTGTNGAIVNENGSSTNATYSIV